MLKSSNRTGGTQKAIILHLPLK